jgi:hypothetical protein
VGYANAGGIYEVIGKKSKPFECSLFCVDCFLIIGGRDAKWELNRSNTVDLQDLNYNWLFRVRQGGIMDPPHPRTGLNTHVNKSTTSTVEMVYAMYIYNGARPSPVGSWIHCIHGYC